MCQAAEAESSQWKQALMEAQAHNQALQEQLGVQRQLLRELELKLHDSQRNSGELHQQVLFTCAHTDPFQMMHLMLLMYPLRNLMRIPEHLETKTMSCVFLCSG